MRRRSNIPLWAIAYTVPFPIVVFITVAFVLYGVFGTPFLVGLIIFLVAAVAFAIWLIRKDSQAKGAARNSGQLPPISMGKTRKTPDQVNRALDNFRASANPNYSYTLEEVVAAITKNEGGYWSPSTIRKYILVRQK